MPTTFEKRQKERQRKERKQLKQEKRERRRFLRKAEAPPQQRLGTEGGFVAGLSGATSHEVA